MVAQPLATDEKGKARAKHNHVDLLTLPNELLVNIFQQLTKCDHIRLLRTCSRINGIIIPFLYTRLPLGYYGVYDEVDQTPRSPFATMAVLKAIRKSELAQSVQFIDHVDHPLPTWTMTTKARKELYDQQDRGRTAIGLSPNAAWTQHRPSMPKCVVDELENVLNQAVSKIRSQVNKLHTVRIVHGSARLIIPLLDMVLQRPSVSKLWFEDVRLKDIKKFLDSTKKQSEDWKTGLTHIRLRRLKAERSEESGWKPYKDPDFKAVSGLMELLLPSSPNLTSICLDAIHDLESLPDLLDCCTFPHLAAFQLRSQTDDQCVVPFYLNTPKILSFFMRHASRLKALAWPAENFIPQKKYAPTLDPLIQILSRNLIWLRTDCSLLSSVTFNNEPRYHGPPRASRLYLAHILRQIPIQTLKLQGDFQEDELEAYFSIPSPSLQHLSLIRGVVPFDIIPTLVFNAPNLHHLKLCAYFSPGLISFHETAIVSATAADDHTILGSNAPLAKFLHTLAPLRHLTHLTLPCATGLDIDDAVVAGIWDTYRRSALQVPVYPVKHDSPETVDENGIVAQVPHDDADALAVQPDVVVDHIVRHLPSQIRNVRLLFILNIAPGRPDMDCHEFCIDVEAKKRPDGGYGLEVLGTPQLSYGWGTGLWQGVTKDLDERAWFGASAK